MDKQYLITRKGTCQELHRDCSSGVILLEGDCWGAPPLQRHREDAEEIASSHPPVEASAAAPAGNNDDIPDIDELELEDAVPDEASFACCSQPDMYAVPYICASGICLTGRTLPCWSLTCHFELAVSAIRASDA